MQRKYKHAKKFSLFTYFSIKMDRAGRNRRRIFVVLASILLISATAMPSFAYLTGTADWSSLNSGLNDLTITNGTVNFNVDYDSAVWQNKNGGTITGKTNPAENDEITYGPVWIIQEGDNKLSSKVDILTEYQVDKDGGSNEVLTSDTDVDVEETVQEPFEVIVGDIDNFGYSVKGDPYLDASAKHDMNVYPESYDAKGTDRRMVGSGFYNKLIEAGLLSNNPPVFGHTWYYLGGTKYYSFQMVNYIAYYGNDTGNYKFVYDGYTKMASQGWKQVNSQNEYYGNANDDWQDNKNWRYLQQSEPVTFKYDLDKNDSNEYKEIKTVTFQIFFDDIQSKGNGKTGDFVSNSGSKFHVYLQAGNEGKIEITEFSDIINTLNQSGPKGNMVTLELPEKYFDIIKNASGLNGSGLQFLIDDPNGDEYNLGYYTGDSFAIDFAKMTVNAPATGSEEDKYYGTLSGTVLDKNGDPIEGATVKTDTGHEKTTDKDGKFLFDLSDKVYKGTCGITISKANYKNKKVFINTGTSDNKIVMDYSSIIMQEKCKVDVTLTKCTKDGETVKSADGNDETITVSSDNLNNGSYYIRKSGTIIDQVFPINYDPEYKYKLEYKVKLKDRDEIKDIQDFLLNFKINNIKVKATQENNPGFDVAGTGDSYQNAFNNLDYNKSLPSEVTPEIKTDQMKTAIYFNVPDTKYFGTPTFYLNGSACSSGLIKSGQGNLTKNGAGISGGEGWYEFEFNDYNRINGTLNSNKGSKIEIKGTTGTEADSGELYWFTTQKVYICTN